VRAAISHTGRLHRFLSPPARTRFRARPRLEGTPGQSPAPNSRVFPGGGGYPGRVESHDCPRRMDDVQQQGSHCAKSPDMNAAQARHHSPFALHANPRRQCSLQTHPETPSASPRRAGFPGDRDPRHSRAIGSDTKTFAFKFNSFTNPFSFICDENHKHFVGHFPTLHPDPVSKGSWKTPGGSARRWGWRGRSRVTFPGNGRITH
jgi:hypothetical protein